MKNMILSLLVLFSVQQVSAKAREFRVLSGTASGDVAMAWGVKGGLVDFENYDGKGVEEQWKFFDQNQSSLENYVVDLKTNRVLVVARPAGNYEIQGPIVEFSDKMNTNYNSMELSYDERNNVGLIQAQGRWSGGTDTLFALKKDKNGENQVIGLCQLFCQTSIIEPAMRAQMTAEQLADYDQYSSKSMSFELDHDKNGTPFYVVIASSMQPKGEGTTYITSMRLFFNNGKFQAVFGKARKE